MPKNTSHGYFLKMDRHPDGNHTSRAQFCVRGRAYLCGPSVTQCIASGPDGQGFTFNATDGSLRSTQCASPHYMCIVAATAGARAAMGDCSAPGASGWTDQDRSRPTP